jgi:hypothetical protein
VTPLSVLVNDVLLQILGRLAGDPWDWVRATCASLCLTTLLGGAYLPPHLSQALLPPRTSRDTRHTGGSSIDCAYEPQIPTPLSRRSRLRTPPRRRRQQQRRL